MIGRIVTLFSPSPIVFYLFIMVSIGSAFTLTYVKGRSDGDSICKARHYTNTLEKINEASRADDDARRCAVNPSCRLSNDGYRRD